jgi:uncharacterized protein (TIGR00297 family)
MPLLLPLLIGFLLSAAIGFVAYRRRSLSRSGVVGALLVGTLTFGIGGLTWAMVVVAFFVSSSVLTHYRADAKRHGAIELAKGGQRDLTQVLANGGVAVLLALAAALWHDRYSTIILAAFVGAMATVTADTWATEIGMGSKTPPRLITTRQVARRGESGGVTLLGFIASATGAWCIGSVVVLGEWIVSWWGGNVQQVWLGLPFVALIAGMLGSVSDSLLGATAQALYYCAPDDKYTESPIHSCGRPAMRVRGWDWINNDMVNFLASVIGAIVGGMLGWLAA